MEKPSCLHIAGIGGLSTGSLAALAEAMHRKADEIESGIAAACRAEATQKSDMAEPFIGNPHPRPTLFAFEMGEVVLIGGAEGTELGEVIARAEYARAEDGYLIRYSAGDGRCTEQWWGVSALWPA